MRKAYEIRTVDNKVMIATNNYQLFDYCNSIDEDEVEKEAEKIIKMLDR